MKAKRGQVTLFIIIAIVVVAAVVLFIVLRRPSPEISEISDIDALEVTDYIQSCLEETSKEGAIILGFQAGQYRTLKPSVVYSIEGLPFIINIPFYDVTDLPEIEDIQHEFEIYIEDNLPVCVNNFTSFEGLIIEAEIPEAHVTLGNKTFIELTFPVLIKKGQNTIALKDTYSYSLPLNLITFYEFSKNIAIIHAEEDTLCYSCILDLADANNFSIELSKIDDEETSSTIYVIETEDNRSLIKNEPYLWLFAIKV